MNGPGDVVRSYLAAFASGDAEAIASHVTDDFANDHASALGESCSGRAAYRDRLPGFLAFLPGVRYEVERLIVEGDQVAVAYRLTATSDGHPVDLRGAMVLDVVDGLIARRTDYWDSLTFLRQTAGT
ncbi:hypothetical protein BH20ACT4_BH20ACT4_07530 [soil metagenome]